MIATTKKLEIFCFAREAIVQVPSPELRKPSGPLDSYFNPHARGRIPDISKNWPKIAFLLSPIGRRKQMAFVIYSARPPANPSDVSVAWPESIPTLEAALSRVLDAMRAAIQHGADMREE